MCIRDRQWTNRPARSNFGRDRNCARGAHKPSRAAPGVMGRRPDHEKRPLGALMQRMAGAYTRVFVRRRSLREHIVPIWSSLRELAALPEAHRAGLVQTRGWTNSPGRARAAGAGEVQHPPLPSIESASECALRAAQPAASSRCSPCLLRPAASSRCSPRSLRLLRLVALPNPWIPS